MSIENMEVPASEIKSAFSPKDWEFICYWKSIDDLVERSYGIFEAYRQKVREYWEDVAKEHFLVRDRAFDDLNRRFAIVTIRGRPCVVRDKDNNDKPLDAPVFYTFDDFCKEHLRNRLFLPELDENGALAFWKRGPSALDLKMKKRPIAPEWLKDEAARIYPTGIDCEPDTEALRHGTYNLWRGFGVQPSAGDWPLIRDHLLNHICRGDQRNFDWLVRWMARCVQKPGLRAEVMVVLRGPEGEGKGWVAALLKILFHYHNFVATSRDDLFGRFNDHLLNTLFLHVDEGYATGSISDDGKLKTLITEPEVPIEIKYVNKFKAKNRLKIMLTTNSDWAVPAGPGARRYFVLDIGEGKAGDKGYFDRLWATLEQWDEISAFFGYLLHLDLSDFDHRRPPMTSGLQDQMEQSLGSFQAWWFSCLEEGRIVGQAWPETIGKEALHEDYAAYAERDGVPAHKRVKSNGVKKPLEKLAPGLATVDNKRGGGERRLWALPTLEACRERWTALYGPRLWLTHT